MTEQQKSMVDELCGVEDGLYDNEVVFIDDLSKKSDQYKLSEKQSAWLERIWNRVWG